MDRATFHLVVSIVLSCALQARCEEPTPPWERTTASEKGGDIWFVDESGNRSRLTESGLDCCPVVSSDKSKIAFVRKTTGKTVDVGFGDVEANEIWIIDLKDRQPRMLVRGSEKIGARLRDPKFSPDGNRIYFAGNLGTPGSVHAVDVHTGALKFISSGNAIIDVVAAGKFKGSLIVLKHKYGTDGAYDWFWLQKPNGEEVAPLGDFHLAQAFCNILQH